MFEIIILFLHTSNLESKIIRYNYTIPILCAIIPFSAPLPILRPASLKKTNWKIFFETNMCIYIYILKSSFLVIYIGKNICDDSYKSIY